MEVTPKSWIKRVPQMDCVVSARRRAPRSRQAARREERCDTGFAPSDVLTALEHWWSGRPEAAVAWSSLRHGCGPPKPSWVADRKRGSFAESGGHWCDAVYSSRRVSRGVWKAAGSLSDIRPRRQPRLGMELPS